MLGHRQLVNVSSCQSISLSVRVFDNVLIKLPVRNHLYLLLLQYISNQAVRGHLSTFHVVVIALILQKRLMYSYNTSGTLYRIVKIMFSSAETSQIRTDGILSDCLSLSRNELVCIMLSVYFMLILNYSFFSHYSTTTSELIPMNVLLHIFVRVVYSITNNKYCPHHSTVRLQDVL